jgi:hypothetical protein
VGVFAVGNNDHVPVNVRPAPDVVAARKREIAQRYARRHGPQTVKGRIISLRRAQVLRLIRHRHGRTLPDDEEGRAVLQLLLELRIHGVQALALAPWAKEGEIDRLITAAEDNWPFWERDSRRNGTITQRLGERLEVTFVEKTALHLHHLGAIDADPAAVADHYRKRKNQRDKARRARKPRERITAQTEATTTPMVPPTGWELKNKSSRSFAVAMSLAIRQCWTLPNLIRHVQWFDEFKGLHPDARRQAVHRAVNALKRYGLVEVGTEGRHKSVRLLASDFAEDLRAMIEQEAFEELQRDIDAGVFGPVEDD